MLSVRNPAQAGGGIEHCPDHVESLQVNFRQRRPNFKRPMNKQKHVADQNPNHSWPSRALSPRSPTPFVNAPLENSVSSSPVSLLIWFIPSMERSFEKRRSKPKFGNEVKRRR